jgi:hypothetical protein
MLAQRSDACLATARILASDRGAEASDEVHGQADLPKAQRVEAQRVEARQRTLN